MVSICGFLIRLAVHSLLLWGQYSILKYSNSTVVRLLSTAIAICGHISYARACVTDPGLDVKTSDLEAVLTTYEAKYDGSTRYCSKCSVYKPDRAHHCSSCRKCVLRMDHHCPWFANCIGLSNHKYFVQFVVYVALFCLVANVISSVFIYDFFRDQMYLETYLEVNFAFFMVIGFALGLVMMGFSIYTIYHVVFNCTTLEAMEAVNYKTSLPASEWRYKHPPSSHNMGNIYDIGIKMNIYQVMGTNKLGWFLPTTPVLPTDGRQFPVNMQLINLAEQRAENEQSLLSRAKRAYG